MRATATGVGSPGRRDRPRRGASNSGAGDEIRAGPNVDTQAVPPEARGRQRACLTPEPARARPSATLFGPSGGVLTPPAAPRKTAVSLQVMWQKCPILKPSRGPEIHVTYCYKKLYPFTHFAHYADFGQSASAAGRFVRRNARNCFIGNHICANMSQGNSPGTNRKDSPRWMLGERYKTDTYRCAIARACGRAFPPPAAAGQGRRRVQGQVAKAPDEEATARTGCLAQGPPLPPPPALPPRRLVRPPVRRPVRRSLGEAGSLGGVASPGEAGSPAKADRHRSRPDPPRPPLCRHHRGLR